MDDRGASLRVEPRDALRLVRSSAQPVGRAGLDGDPRLVADRVRRILRGRSRQPDRREDDDAGAAEDHAGGGHAARLHAVLGAGDAPARLVELPGGRGLHLRGGLFHLQGLTGKAIANARPPHPRRRPYAPAVSVEARAGSAVR